MADERRPHPPPGGPGVDAGSPQGEGEAIEQLELGLRLIMGLVGLVGAIVLVEVLARAARRTSVRVSQRHPILAELYWEARHRPRRS
jgi:hypothetical protein